MNSITAAEQSDGDFYLADADLASVLRMATRLLHARLASGDEVPAVLGTVAAELGVACGRLYEEWDARERAY